MPVQSLIINQFKSGWIPSDDPLSGRKDGLIQMDNVELDENGALSLVGGTSVISSYASAAHTLYSRYLNATLVNYLALADGTVYRNTTSIVSSGGDSTNAAFATAFNYTLACSGNKRVKDDGTTAIDLGIKPPTAAPTVSSATVSNAPYCLIGSPIANTVTPIGTSAVVSGYLQITTDANGDAAVQTYPGTLENATVLTGVGAGNTGYQQDSDIIIINGFSAAPPIDVSFKFDVLLDNPGAAGDVVTNYFTYYISDLTQLTFDPTLGTFYLAIPRNQFQRIGAGTQGWESVYGFRITIASPSNPLTTLMNVWAYAVNSSFVIQGGSNSQTGSYQYAQINVNNTGSYLAKSVLGPVSNVVRITANQGLITPQDPSAIDTQVNEVWIFRRSVDQGLLDQWYRVAVFTAAGGYTQIYDKVGDQAALVTDITVNLSLASIASSSISDKIYDIVGPIEGRWFYFTTNMMYPSDINNPDLVDTTRAVRTTGSNSEIFLWARKVTDSIVLVGTSQDIYILSGTFITQPDYSIDIYYKPLGCKFPPITYDADVYSGSVYYLSNDGWRSYTYLGNNPWNPVGSQYNLSGTNPLIVSPNLDRLYRGESIDTPFTQPVYDAPSLAFAPGSIRFPITVAKNKLWCFIHGTTRLEVYDFVRQYWGCRRYSLTDVTAAFAAPDGSIIAFYGDNKLRTIDVHTNKLIDNLTKQTIGITFPVMDNGTPRQRKDAYTLKLRCYTGSAAGSIVFKFSDEAENIYSPSNAAAIKSFSIDTEVDFDLSSTVLNPVKTFQVNLTGAVDDFVLSDITIEHDLRPIQLTFLRLLANNYNAVARKRIYNIPFQIDTLGNNVTMIDKADGANQPPLLLNCATKKSFSYDFKLSNNDVTRAVDHEFTIDGGGKLFEFFGFQDILPEDMEVYPTPNYSYVIPVTNFNVPNKKRLRTWPFEICSRGGLITFTPIVDGVLRTDQSTYFQTDGRDDIQTLFHFFTKDVFGIDYSGTFNSLIPFELRKIHSPDIVQILPIARRFDQVGPEEFFKYGRVKKLELRVLPYGVSLPITIYFNDNETNQFDIPVVNGKEASYYIGTDKGTGGEIVRIEIGPTDFDFHRYYIRLQVMKSGQDTSLEWVILPPPPQEGQNG